MSFRSLGLSTELLSAVSAQGYDLPTPIQSKTIPVILEGRDVLAIAQTGTGKTAGFTLPLLQRLCLGKRAAGPRAIRALILAPTRELAAQVEQCVTDFGQHLPIRSAAIYGGVSIRPQIAAMRRGVDVVVATPGRLLDHATQRTIDLSRVEILVLDEADRMLDMGFIRDIRKIIDLLPKQRQNLLFSATFNRETTELAGRLLQSPERIEVAGNQRTADTVAQRVYPVAKSRKRELLSWLIGSENWRQVLVFTRTKHAANRLATQLDKDGLNSTAIHGNKSQAARSRALRDFKNGQVRVLVATDIAARGLDIDQLPHVVNFDLPQVPEDYVHRVGRTGRAGLEGEAISLVAPEDQPLLTGIERLLKRKIPRQDVTEFAADSREIEEAASSAPTRRGGHARQPAAGKQQRAAGTAGRPAAAKPGWRGKRGSAARRPGPSRDSNTRRGRA